MKITKAAITGSENRSMKILQPEYSLIEFYNAFNHCDRELMSKNWVQTEEASMSNPLGGVKRGWQSIKTVYDKIFDESIKVYVEFYDYTIHQSGEMFIAVGHERGYFQKGTIKVDLAIRTSRTYRMDCGRWYQIHHHGSIDKPELLNHYQTTALNH